MRRKWSLLFIIFVLTWLALFWLPWWSSAVVGFLVIFIFQKKQFRNTFLTGGIAGALAWLFFSVWKDLANQQILSQKIAELFHLPAPYLLWVLEFIIGFITTGLGCWFANSLKKQKDPLFKTTSEKR